MWISDGNPNNVSRLLHRFIQDNNIVELEAASEAIRITLRLGVKKLNIMTDSEHFITYNKKLKEPAYKLSIFDNFNLINEH